MGIDEWHANGRDRQAPDGMYDGADTLSKHSFPRGDPSYTLVQAFWHPEVF
jgi:hypothetical protein